VYRAAHDCQNGSLNTAKAEVTGVAWPRCLSPALRQGLFTLLKKAPSAYGWCRTRWSCARLALPLPAQRGIRLSAETVRGGLPAMGWVWKRAQLVAQDSDPERAAKWARIRRVSERLGRREALLFADELDLHLRPKVGAPWMPRATPVELMTPGKNERRYRAGALDLRTGQVHHGLWFRKRTGLFLDLLNRLDQAYPARRLDRI
jgi:Winged helix-turn helix